MSQEKIQEQQKLEEVPSNEAEQNKSGLMAQQLLASPDKTQILEQESEQQAKQMLESLIKVPVETEEQSMKLAESIIVNNQRDQDANDNEVKEITLLNQQSQVYQNAAKLKMQQTMIGNEEQDEVEVEEVTQIADNFFYPDDHSERQVEELPISQSCLQFHETFGHDSLKKYNLWLVDDQTITFSSGIGYHFLNFVSGQSQLFFSRDGGGIGSIAIHPNRKYYAIAEKGQQPNVYIYAYPEHRLYRVLRKGTEKSYSSSTFSQDGSKFCTVGSAPDYQICIWDWKQETILLKAKAFAQEVYRVQFSTYNPNILATSGMGHIKFWKVAQTFTGLKLKGEIAKFGQVELSDVYAFFQFPDGKVLSGTEYGRLILWEGNVIKCVIGESSDKPCHQGQIEVIILDQESIITAGTDGYIKQWKFADIDTAEGDDQLNYYTRPTKEVKLETDKGDVASITSIQRTEAYWVVGDSGGRIWKLYLPELDRTEIILSTNAGKFHDLAVSPINNSVVTVGQDGQIRLWDYVNRNLHFERRFPCEATCVLWVPFNKKNQGRVVIVGYSNGIVRVLLMKQDGFFLLRASKVHSSSIQMMRTTADGSLLAVLSQNGHLFLLSLPPNDLQQLEPFCLYETGIQVSDLTFDKRGEKLLMGSRDGKIYEITVPRQEEVDNSQTYLIPFNPRTWTIRMMESQKPKKEEMDLEFLLRRNKDEKLPEVEWDPAPILNVTYYDQDCSKVLVSADGKYLGNLYIVDWQKDRPIDSITGPRMQTQFMEFQDNYDLLVVGYRNGQFQLRHRNDLRQYTQKDSHDVDIGRVRKVAVNQDRTGILSAADDGTMCVYKIDYQGFVQAARGMYIEQYCHCEIQNAINSGTFSEDLQMDSPIEEDILNDKIYSIQEAKLLAEEDNKKNEADKKKQKVLAQVKELRSKFQEIHEKNRSADEFSRLSGEELCVDPEYIEMLHARVQEDLEETRKELEWDKCYAKLMADKLKSYVKDELEVDKFGVRSIKNNKNIVYTFKVKRLSEYVEQQLQEIYRLIEEEKRNQAQREEEQQQQQVQKNQTQELKQSVLLQSQSLMQSQNMQQDDINAQEGDVKQSSAKAERLRQKQEEEKIRREQEELEKSKPTKESFEPDHIRDIQEAIESLGDYKLKSSKDYVVPEHQRMNVSKKRKHMFLLEEFVYNTKIKFNQQLINLRQRKQDLVDKIKRYNQQIIKINQELGKWEDLFVPEIDLEREYPDHFMEVSDEQIDEWAKQKAREGSKKSGGFGGMGGGNEPTQPALDKKQTQTIQSNQQTTKATEPLKVRKGIRIQQSELEEEMKIIQEMILQAEKRRMLDEIEEEISSFDKDVVKCQNEKSVLESDMNIAKMKLITFYQELIILEEMEEYDNRLIKELLDFKREKTNLDDQSQRIIENLQNLAKKEQQNEKELNEQMKAFKELVYPDDDGKREKIHQYYSRKFKKDKAKKMKVNNQDDDNDDDDEENESDIEEDDDEFLDDDDNEKPDISPVENDVKIKEIIDKICELEDSQETNRKEKMDSDRQKVQVANKIQIIQKDLKRAEDDLRAYQRKKLQRVNQLDVSYMIRLSQVQNITNQGDTYKLPTDLNYSILFTEGEFYRLCKRIRELELEQNKIEKQKIKKEKTKKLFEKEIAIKDSKIADLHKKYEEKHMLKFGDIIDLKILDALEPTKQVLEMRDQFKKEEKEAVKRVEESKKNLQEIKRKLLDAKKENTKIINNITKLGKQQMDLSKKLDSTNKQLFKEENEERRSDLEREKQNLKDLVKFLSKEIDDLKTEIGLFKRKGGHIYTMVTSTKKQYN